MMKTDSYTSIFYKKIKQDVADVEKKIVDNHIEASKEEKETSSADVFKELPKPIQKKEES